MYDNNTDQERMETEASDNNNLQDQVNNNTEDERSKKQLKTTKDKEYMKTKIMTSGRQFIKVFQKLLKETEATREEIFHYMQRVYHSIFFFGHINQPQIEPKDFFPAGSWEKVNKILKIVEKSRTHLPPQTPYSILLEYITKHYNRNKDSILEEMQKRNKEMCVTFYEDQNNQLETNHFAASVITYSYVNDPYSDNNLKTAFGASIAYKHKEPRRIMIDISTLHVWDKVISYSVRCGERGNGIDFPCTVECKAFKFDKKNKEFKPCPPCEKCYKTFKNVKFDPIYVIPTKRQDWKYGNCAETESLSNLLRDNINIRNAVFTFNESGFKLNRQAILERFEADHKNKLKTELKNLLGSLGLKATEWSLFSPAAYGSP